MRKLPSDKESADTREGNLQ